MLISHKKQFIFIHIFKTAGTSVTDIFVPYARLTDRLAHQYYISRKFINGINRLLGISHKGGRWFTGYHKHATAKDIRNKMDQEVFRSYFKFAFVRDPYDWLVSYFYYIRQSGYHHLHKRFMNMEFNEFVAWHIRQQPVRQHEFVEDEKGNILVDFIGKLEKLDEDVHRICQHLNIPPKPIKSKNITQNIRQKDYKSLYNRQTLDLVNEYYARDFELFGYEKI